MPLRYLFANRRERFRLLSDHHQLVLEHFCLQDKRWKPQARIECERLHEALLADWLQSCIKAKKAVIELLLAGDALQFLQPDYRPAAPEQSPAFIREISSALALAAETEMLMMDAYYSEQSLQVVLLHKASVMPYLQAFKTCKLVLQRIAPVTFPQLNLLPWREQKAKQVQRQHCCKLALFPVAALILLLVSREFITAKLQKLQLLNQRLQVQLHSFQAPESVMTLTTVLPLLRQVMQQGEGLNFMEIRQSGEVRFAGISVQQGRLHAMLKDFAAASQLEAGSMRNWTLTQGERGAIWSVSYRLKQAES